MLTERSYYLWEKQTELGHVGVRRVTEILKDGVVISKTYWRCILSPGDDLDAARAELNKIADATEVIEVAKKIHTPEAIKAFKATLLKI